MLPINYYFFPKTDIKGMPVCTDLVMCNYILHLACQVCNFFTIAKTYQYKWIDETFPWKHW